MSNWDRWWGRLARVLIFAVGATILVIEVTGGADHPALDGTAVILIFFSVASWAEGITIKFGGPKDPLPPVETDEDLTLGGKPQSETDQSA
jgi:hypothetical protein